MFSLGNISGYTFHGACWGVEELVKALKAGGYSVAGLSDYGGFRGAVAFSQACEQEGLRMILGTRLCVNQAAVGDIQITVRTKEGYERVNRLISGAVLGEIEWKDLVGFQNEIGEGAWLSYPVRVKRVMGKRLGGYHAWLAGWERLQEIDAGNLWIELGWQSEEERLLQRRVYGDLKRLGWKRWVIMSGARHANRRGMAEMLEVLQSIATLTRIDQRHPQKLPCGDYGLLEAAEVKRRYGKVPDVFESSREFMDACVFDFQYGRLYMPLRAILETAESGEADRRLAYLCLRGLVGCYGKRYPWPEKPERDVLLERLRRELSVVSETGYSGYFLIFAEVVAECERREIPVLARGSAAGSLICYTLGVGNVCPFRFGLSFERFLNRERLRHSKLPDIDLDLPWDRRDEIIAWLYERFGKEHVAMIGGFNTFQGRAAVAEIAKAMGYPVSEAYAWTKRLPHGSLQKFINDMEGYVETADARADERFIETLQMANRLDGLPRHGMMHPCGVVIADRPITHFMPVEPSNKGFVMTQMDMHAVEDVGLLKMDLLGQAGLSVIRDCRENLRREVRAGRLQRKCGGPDPSFPLTEIDYAAEEIYKMIRTGGARGVFHIESPAMTSLLRLCQCADIDCLVATVSVIRPGAANENKKAKFARRYLGLEPVQYVHPDLEPVLRDSYGLLIYEEHILFVANRFAGMDYGTADLLRRILIKKKDATALEELETLFRTCALQYGRTEEEIDRVWRELRDFSGFMFNKAHGAAYAVEAFQGCWLKAHWPLYFLAAVLNNQRGFYSANVYTMEILRSGGELRLPDVESEATGYWCSGREIQIPLWAIKGLSERFLHRWAREREKGPFGSWQNFARKTHLERNDAELLARAGAFRAYFGNRHEAIWRASYAAGRKRKPEDEQGDLFSGKNGDVAVEVKPGQFPEPSSRICAEMEIALLGYPVSETPFQYWLADVDRERTVPIARLLENPGCEVEIAGVQVCTRLHRTLRGELMKFVSLADETGIAELVLFPEAYRQYGLAWTRKLGVRARVEVAEAGDGIILIAGE